MGFKGVKIIQACFRDAISTMEMSSIKSSTGVGVDGVYNFDIFDDRMISADLLGGYSNQMLPYFRPGV